MRQAFGAKMAGSLGYVLAYVFALCLVVSNLSMAQARPKRIIAFGDSLSAGFQLPASAAFPAVLEKALKAEGFDVSVINAAVSGETVAGGLERIDWALAEGADIVILELGANDMLRGLDPARTRAGLDTLINKIQAKGARVVLAGMRATPSMGADYAARFDAIYPDLAKKYALPLYPLFLNGIIGVASLHLSDGLHPNKLGVEVMVAGIEPLIARVLRE